MLSLCLAVSGLAAHAASFSYYGEFGQDDDVEYIHFTVAETLVTATDSSTATSVVIRTYSYAGGVQADGTVVAPGGFDPILTLYNGAGNFIGETDDDDTGLALADPVSGASYDAGAEFLLPEGSYTLAISQYSNYAYLDSTLSDPFIEDGGNFTGAAFGCSNGQFCDFLGNNRTGSWALSIENVEISPVPLPASMLFVLTGCLLLLRIGRTRNQIL